MRNHINSKRFTALILSTAIFCIGTFIFKIDTVHLAKSITLLLAPYLAVQTYKPSQ